MPDDRLTEVLLAAEVVVEQPARDPGLLGEDVDGDLLHRPGGEEPGPEVEELAAALVRGEADAGGGRAHAHHLIDGYSITPIPSPHDAAPTPLPTAVNHLVVGAGFAGLGMAIKLAEAGENDFLVIEKDGGIGGTWRANTYPGAACDVPSQLYSFSFAPNPDWSMSFSPQPEIEAYLRRVAERSGTLDRFAFDTELTEARWDEPTSAGTSPPAAGRSSPRR